MQIAESSKDKMYKSIQIRTTTKNFMTVIARLKPNQKKWVEEVGLGTILDLKIDTIPSKLAFYVVDSLDIKRKAIKTSNGYIQINEDSVTEIFGLKNEGQDIYEIVVPEERNEIKENWNKQFADDKNIRQRDIVNKIVESICVDTNFKLNFIVLFINSMISTTKMGLCSTGFVSNVVPNFDYKNINWCKYIYDITMASKNTWNRFSKTDFYTGPITFLTLIYVNSTKCTEYHHRRLKPAILEWTSEMLRKREKFEMENGGFGNLQMNTDDVEDTIISKGEKQQRYDCRLYSG